jgi:hypothetical protein
MCAAMSYVGMSYVGMWCGLKRVYHCELNRSSRNFRPPESQEACNTPSACPRSIARMFDWRLQYVHSAGWRLKSLLEGVAPAVRLRGWGRRAGAVAAGWRLKSLLEGVAPVVRLRGRGSFASAYADAGPQAPRRAINRRRWVVCASPAACAPAAPCVRQIAR